MSTCDGCNNCANMTPVKYCYFWGNFQHYTVCCFAWRDPSLPHVEPGERTRFPAGRDINKWLDSAPEPSAGGAQP